MLHNLLCTNNVQHGAATGRTIVFTNPSIPGANYVYITSNPDEGTEYIEGQFYDINAECDIRGILTSLK